MNEYEVVYEGRVREVYYVEAHSEEEALERWHENDPMESEVFDGEVVEVLKI